MKQRLLLITIACISTGCTVDSQSLQRLAKQEGISQFVDQGYAWWGCGEGDTFHSAFSGVKNGQPVKGYICGGFLKGYTVRYE